ncbi:MAG: hypothetical protein SVP26_09430 [Chloroflexota bacterium]|nr:hypothetical protein [Chloroflexota bacterium]
MDRAAKSRAEEGVLADASAQQKEPDLLRMKHIREERQLEVRDGEADTPELDADPSTDVGSSCVMGTASPGEQKKDDDDLYGDLFDNVVAVGEAPSIGLLISCLPDVTAQELYGEAQQVRGLLLRQRRAKA